MSVVCKNISLISVLMPAYNHERYIEESIRSVIKQDYKNIELIVVDDGSSDGTWQKIIGLKQECNERFVRTIVKTRENRGVCETLNELIELSQGEYSYLFASDDRIQDIRALTKLYQTINSNKDIVLVVGDNEIIDENSQRIAWDINQKITSDKMGYNTVWKFLCAKHEYVRNISNNLNNFGSYDTIKRGNYVPNGFLVRNIHLKQIEKFTKKAPTEDWFLHLQLSLLGKYKFINEVLYSYRWHDGNTIKNRKENRKKNRRTKIFFWFLRIKRRFMNGY